MTRKRGTKADQRPKTSITKSSASTRIARAGNFVKALLSDKRGAFGIGILVLMGLAALAAPILTPYDPLHSPEMIADGLTYPYWFKYLPGYEKTSENLFPFKDPGFANEASIQEWFFTASQPSTLTLNYVSTMGSPNSGPGCIRINLQRSDQEKT